jgi:hypothetical protein
MMPGLMIPVLNARHQILRTIFVKKVAPDSEKAAFYRILSDKSITARTGLCDLFT